MKKNTLNLICLLISLSLFGQNNQKISKAALELTKDNVTYDPAYFKIPYPNGDIPKDKGVCTDVIIRTYRKLGVDLQKLVHEDMSKNFKAYPQKWGLKSPDSNIDHRRVPNLMTFFKKFGKIKPNTSEPKDYTPGDIVVWELTGNLTHIGIVVNKKTTDQSRHLVVHNIGNGQELSDCLFLNKIIGHYTY